MNNVNPTIAACLAPFAPKPATLAQSRDDMRNDLMQAARRKAIADLSFAQLGRKPFPADVLEALQAYAEIGAACAFDRLLAEGKIKL